MAAMISIRVMPAKGRIRLLVFMLLQMIAKNL